jgi:hypothetical protein
MPDDVSPISQSPQTSDSSFFDFFTNVSWQTWLIIILILTLLGINIFSYLAKGTQETASLVNQIFGPIFKIFGDTTLETTKQTLENTAIGTKAGVDIVANAKIEVDPKATSGTSIGVSTPNIPYGQQAGSSLPVQNKIQEEGSNNDKWDPNSLEKALEDSSQYNNQGPLPTDSSNSGKAGWCFIGEDQGVRSCSEIGVNDMCMSGDVFPTQAVCMNPNLRA